MRRRNRNARPEEATRNRLYRDSKNGMIFGVCAGLADYFGFDLKVTRICTAIAGLFVFPTVPIIYFILGVLLDESPHITREEEREEYELRRRVRAEPHATLRSVRHRFRELDRRLQRLEKYVTSKKYNLQREFDGLGD